MSSFFTLPASQRRRKRNDTGPTPPIKKRTVDAGAANRGKVAQTKKPREDESISGSESDDEDLPAKKAATDDVEGDGVSSESEHEDETGAERRLRLAERYLENIKGEVRQTGFDAEEIDRDLIAERLKEDVAESKGRLYRHIASSFAFDQCTKTHFRADTLSTTSIATCPPYAYTVSKDITLIKWELLTPHLPSAKPPSTAGALTLSRRRPKKLLSTKGYPHKSSNSSYQHHTAPILAIAASPDGQFLATGGLDKRLIIWSAETLTPLRVFNQHRDAITSLAFRRGTNQLFSASADRTIKTWSLDQLAYIETLFGHQDAVVDVASLAQERCLSVGARDRTARLWKVIEETQLVFRGGGSSKLSRTSMAAPSFAEGSIDRVALVDEETFVTGSDNGSLSLWSAHKKKPVFTVPLAHGCDPALQPEDAFAEEEGVLRGKKVPSGPTPRWITALVTVPYSDLVLSGSWDGWVRAWRVSEDKRRLEGVRFVGRTLKGTGGGEKGGKKGGRSGGGGEGDGDVAMDDGENVVGEGTAEEGEQVVKGVINDIAVFERGDRGQDGLCIVAAVGTEHRLGRWMKVKGKNGAVVFEVGKMAKPTSYLIAADHSTDQRSWNRPK